LTGRWEIGYDIDCALRAERTFTRRERGAKRVKKEKKRADNRRKRHKSSAAGAFPAAKKKRRDLR
jgi:hypothetical protein